MQPPNTAPAVAAGVLRLGEQIEADSGNRDGVAVALGRDALTTHGVIVGMTGSGKTGLGIVLLEEVLRSGVPALIIDPKGDMANLALTFPSLSADAFAPWIDPGQAARSGELPAAHAAAVAGTWRKGLADWGLGGEDVQALRDAAEVVVYTPGSAAGVGISVLGSLAPPPRPFDDDAEDLRDEIEAFVSSLLLLAGIEADPMSSREHILVSQLITRAWRAGQGLDLDDLILQVATPPLRSIGVFELDRFFPEKERNKLAMRLNGLVASPSFQPWLAGEPLDIQHMLYGADGRPRAAVIYLAHLADEQRMFAVTLLLSKVVSWMRRQPGTSDLRALVYMDEVYGFCPPTAAPPSKGPILTLLKQARAHGVGVVLATQNPVDLDYKAMSNAGTWMVGRLSTERDKARIVEALRSASGDVEIATLDRLIGGLGKRQFLMLGARSPKPRLFTSRFALSYLRGPLTRDEVKALRPAAVVASPASAPMSAAATPHAGPAIASTLRAVGGDGSRRSVDEGDDDGDVTLLPPAPRVRRADPLPAVADGVRVAILAASAPWAAEVGAIAGSSEFHAVVAFRLRLAFMVPGGVAPFVEEWEAVWPRPTSTLQLSQLRHVDYDERDLRGVMPSQPRWHLPEAPIASPDWWRDIGALVVASLQQSASRHFFSHAAYAMASRPGETEASFLRRTRAEAETRADREAATLAHKWADHAAKQRARIEAAAYDTDARAAKADVTVAQAEIAAEQAALIGALVRGSARSGELAAMAAKLDVARSDARAMASARDKVSAARAQIDQFEAELGGRMSAIHAAALATADAITRHDVTLGDGDVSIAEVVLCWVPGVGSQR